MKFGALNKKGAGRRWMSITRQRQAKVDCAPVVHRGGA